MSNDETWSPQSLIPLVLLCAAPQAFGTVEPVPCADQSVVASTVRTPKELQAFVQCAYEFVREVGFEEARRAFHEDERWRSGPIYIFFDEVSPVPETSRVFPPDPEMEGLTIAPRETDRSPKDGTGIGPSKHICPQEHRAKLEVCLPYILDVYDEHGKRVDCPGSPKLAPAQHRILKARRKTIAEYERTGNRQVMIDVGLFPPEA